MSNIDITAQVINGPLYNRFDRKLILWYVATLRDPAQPGGELMYRLGPFSTESEARKAGQRWELDMGGAHKTPYWWVAYKVEDATIVPVIVPREG